MLITNYTILWESGSKVKPHILWSRTHRKNHLTLQFYIEGVSENSQFTSSFLPAGAEHNVFVYQVDYATAEEDVVVNELMASNSTTASDEWGEFDDWIEFYNKGAESVDLFGYFLSDKTDNITKWSFPESTPILPGEYLIVWADGQPEQGPLHTNFKLSAAGENIILTNPNMEIIQSVEFAQQITDMGYARVPNAIGEFTIQTPTYAANNDLMSNALTGLQQEEAPKVYPNPVVNYLHIETGLHGTCRIEVFNLIGVLIMEGMVARPSILDVSSLEEGIYFIRAHGMTRKFIKIAQ